ncbi:hypothetical protein NLU13_5281 [Sarocladium strictum]|uniref:Centrosomin N-terminal motif 1 domain-containing protein n=1 Tax=Sarocladium strictum TaxID=5046 RepID=A0AA39GHV7_SARSR|nr:hypothetical protein NLU13_5281 [Sarocladium strictum]
MDAATTQFRDKSRPPYPRTASRSSTSTNNTRVTNQTNNSGGSSSPQLAHSHPAHRYHHNACAKPSATSPTVTTRPTPQLSREASNESNRPSAMSSFLQEKLQRERQLELNKTVAASPSSKSGSLSASMDLGRATNSPFKDSSTNRPQSSSGDPGNGKKGHGNFDLKLELYHRRERQTALEDRVEALESGKAQVEQMNDRLMEELEKRDKAVEEAVAMIVTLEAKIDQLAQERRMVQQIEAEGMFRSPDFGSSYQLTVHSQDTEGPHPDEDARTLTRMPSFLSDRTEETENLRNVYLHGRSSVMSLPRVSEPLEGLTSPSLSVLSESSFVSVYGQKGHDKVDPLDLTEPLSLDGSASKTGSSMDTRRPSTATGRSGSFKKSASSASPRSNGNAQFSSFTDVVGQSSPLQRLEKMDPTYARRPQSSGRDMTTINSSRVNNSPARRRTREEKREALKRVMTDAPGGVLLQEHALPPTPDTMSTSTLRRFRNSNDTLEGEAKNEMRPQPTVLEKQAEPHTGAPLQPSASALPKVLDLSINSYPDHIAAIRRPRSADETTVSQHRRGNDWSFDSDEEDGQSFRSSLDIWMRQGGSKQEVDGRVSPDLFGFPTSASRGAWAMDAMFGPGSAYAGGAQIMGSGQAMDELFSAQGKPENQGPPPPGRRSSYHARTGSSSATTTMTSQTQSQPPKHKSPQRKQPRQHTRGASVDVRARSMSVAQSSTDQAPAEQHQQPQSQDKRGHYPPLSGAGGARAGLNRLFRRSLGGAADAGLPPRSPSAPVEARTESSLPPPPSQQKSTMGTLSWVHRSGVTEDERSGATPPPIMRNPRHQRTESVEQDMQEPPTPTAPAAYPQAMEVAPPLSPAEGPQQQQGGRRKWLGGFGRSSSLRNRAG